MKDVSCEIGSNFANVSLGVLDVYFSYKTPIAFRCPGYGLVVRQNDWSKTTGKHLNAIDSGNKAARVSGEMFEDLFHRALEGLNLV